MHALIRTLALASTVAFALSPAMAEMRTVTIDLNGASEVPPTNSTATGEAEIKFDTDKKELSWTIKSEGLSGDATAAHFHGPASPTESAPPVIDISDKIASGSVMLTDAQVADLEAGRLYLNVHTANFPDGEIRGQVMMDKKM